MDTRALKNFLAIVEHGGMAKASKHLHLTASALSHSLKTLESELETRLFDRVGRRLVLNQAGEQLLEQVQAPLATLEAAAAGIRSLRQWGQGRLRLGAAVTACQHILPRVLRDLRTDYPKLLIEVQSGDTDRLVDALRQHRIDVALCIEPDDTRDLKLRGLFEDELLLAMSGDHRWARSESISDEELAREPLILYRRASRTYTVLNQYFTARGITPSSILEVESVTAIREMVKLKLGIAMLAPWVVDAELTRGEIRMRSLGPRAVKRRWAVISLDSWTATLAAEKFYALCRRQAAGMRLDRRDLPTGSTDRSDGSGPILQSRLAARS